MLVTDVYLSEVYALPTFCKLPLQQTVMAGRPQSTNPYAASSHACEDIHGILCAYAAKHRDKELCALQIERERVSLLDSAMDRLSLVTLEWATRPHATHSHSLGRRVLGCRLGETFPMVFEKQGLKGGPERSKKLSAPDDHCLPETPTSSRYGLTYAHPPGGVFPGTPLINNYFLQR